jgi:hypothetical protein
LAYAFIILCLVGIKRTRKRKIKKNEKLHGTKIKKDGTSVEARPREGGVLRATRRTLGRANKARVYKS